MEAPISKFCIYKWTLTKKNYFLTVHNDDSKYLYLQSY